MFIPSMLIFLFQFSSAKMHSQKSFSGFFCKLNVPMPDKETQVKIGPMMHLDL